MKRDLSISGPSLAAYAKGNWQYRLVEKNKQNREMKEDGKVWGNQESSGGCSFGY